MSSTCYVRSSGKPWLIQVILGQRNWAVTRGTSKRHYLSTGEIVLCVGVIIHDPQTQTAALAHVDEYQDYTTLTDIIDAAFPNNNN